MGTYLCEVCQRQFLPLAENQKVCGKACRLEVNRRRDRARYEANREKKLAMVHKYRRGETRERWLALSRENQRRKREQAYETRSPNVCPICCEPLKVKYRSKYCGVECAYEALRRRNAIRQNAMYHALSEAERKEWHKKTAARHREKMKDPEFRAKFEERRRVIENTPEVREKKRLWVERWYARKSLDPEFMRRQAERKRKHRLRVTSRKAAKELLNDLGPKLKEMLHVREEFARHSLCPDRC